MVIGKPRFTHHSRPGEMRSFTFATLLASILSPGETSAHTLPPANVPAVTATNASPIALRIVIPPFTRERAPLAPLSTSGRDERRDREPVVRDPRLLTLVEVPALLAGETRARQRSLGGVLELHVHHHDGRNEPHLVGVRDGVAARDRLPVDPVVVSDLQKLTGANVVVGVGDVQILY